ncbi:MAG TPA: glycosyltransferase [Solirubrobacterales bacterium]|jgi:glycosyltransferase involved in cell wall biosynthesis
MDAGVEPAMGSVVIPAHDEAAVIGRCLDALFTGVEPCELEVIVVCNGCTDGTADVVRWAGHPVQLIELDEASKPAALRAGDAAAMTFPRLYLDADVSLAGSAARRVLERLHDGAIAARPPIRYDAEASSVPVRRYYRARSRLPAVLGSLWGAGVYGLSAAGRHRFGAFPDVIADDFWVDGHFAADEVEIVDCQPVVVRAPRSSRDLVRVLRRVYLGKGERASAPDQDDRAPETVGFTLRDLGRLAVRGPVAALDAATYAAFATGARLALAFGAPAADGWGRDHASRAALR